MSKFKLKALLSCVLAVSLFTPMAAQGLALSIEENGNQAQFVGTPRSAVVNWVTNLASNVGRWNKTWDKDTFDQYTLVLPRDQDSFILTPEVFDKVNTPTLILFESGDAGWQELERLSDGSPSTPISIPQGEKRDYKLQIIPYNGGVGKSYEFTCYHSTVRMQLQVDSPQKGVDGKERVNVRLVADVAAEKAFHLGATELRFTFPADRLQMDNGSGDNLYGVWHEQIKGKMKPQGTPILNNETGNYALSLIANRLSSGGAGVEDISFGAGASVLAAFSFVVKDGVLFDPADIKVSAFHYSDSASKDSISMRDIQDDTTGDFFETVKTTAPVIDNLVPQGLDGSNSELIRQTPGGGQGFTSTCTDYTLNYTGGMENLSFTAAYSEATQSLAVTRIDKEGNATPVSLGDDGAYHIMAPEDGETILFQTAFLATPGNSTAYRVNLKLMDITLNYEQPTLEGAFYKIPITVGQDTKLAGIHFRLILSADAQFEKSESANGNFYIVAQQEGVTEAGKKYVDIDLVSAASEYVEMKASELLFTLYVSVPVGNPAPTCELTNVIVLTKDADVPAGVTRMMSMSVTASTWNPNDSITVKVYPFLNGKYSPTPMYTITSGDHPADATYDMSFEQKITFQVPADQPFKVELSKARHLTYVLEFPVGGASMADTLVFPCGDVDGDGFTSQMDRNLLLSVLAGGVSADADKLARYDLNGDDALSQEDLNILSMHENFNKRPADAQKDLRPSAPQP